MDKVAVLIAAGSGMGANAAKKLSKDGFKIAVMSSSDKAIKLSNSFNGIGFVGSNQNIKDIKKFINWIFKC